MLVTRQTFVFLTVVLTTWSVTWHSGTARWLQILRDEFGSWIGPIAFDMCAGWLLTRRAQAHFAVSLNCC